MTSSFYLLEKNIHWKHNALKELLLISDLLSDIESDKVDYKLLLSKYAKNYFDIDEIKRLDYEFEQILILIQFNPDIPFDCPK